MATRNNPFQSPAMRGAFDGALNAYLADHKDIIRDGRRCNGNSVATMFWRGYDGVRIGISNFSDPGSRRLMAYAHFRAGVAARVIDDGRWRYVPKEQPGKRKAA